MMPFQRIIKEKHDANIMFLIQQANVRAGELKTAKAFWRGGVAKSANDAANKKISNIEISAYASPDGGVSLNSTLAENRQNNTAKIIDKDLKKPRSMPGGRHQIYCSDWEGFQELVKSNIQDKELILRVLSGRKVVPTLNRENRKSRTSLPYTRIWLTKCFRNCVVPV